MDGGLQKVQWEGFINGGVVGTGNRIEDVQSYMENRRRWLGDGYPLVANRKREKGHNETRAGGLKANNDGKALREEGAVEEDNQEPFFTSAEGRMEAGLEMFLF